MSDRHDWRRYPGVDPDPDSTVVWWRCSVCGALTSCKKWSEPNPISYVKLHRGSVWTAGRRPFDVLTCGEYAVASVCSS